MGLTEVVEGLKAKKTIVTEHLNFVEQERVDISNNRGKIERIKLSYTKGFKRGASALSNSFITSSNI
jgi:NifB/MoaA-like Fe-S oxidoreductase